jgi:hypothetical protein
LRIPPSPCRSAARVALFAAAVAGFIMPASSCAGAGEEAASFLRIEVGARAVGMAGALGPIADGETSLAWNPAGLAAVTGPSFGAMHAQWFEDLGFEWVGGCGPAGSLGSFGLSAAVLRSPPIAGYDEFGTPTGPFTADDAVLTFGWGRSVGAGVSVGLTAKAIQQRVAGESARGVAGDVGLLAESWGWRFGAVLRNLGPDVLYGEESHPLPFGVSFGIARALAPNALFAVSMADAGGPFSEGRAGVEWSWRNAVALRAGYRAAVTGDDPASGLTAGVGVARPGWAVDYAFTPHRDLGATHRVSLAMRFGAARSDAASHAASSAEPAASAAATDRPTSPDRAAAP